MARLKHDGFGRRYRELLAAALDWIDARLSPQAEATAAAAKTEAARAWSIGLLDKCLLLAVAYPLFSLLLHWGFSGEAGRIGPLVVLPPEPERLKRAAAIGAVTLTIAAGLRLGRASTLRQHFVALGLFFVAVAVASTSVGAFEVVVASVVAFGVAFVFAFGAEFADGYTGGYGGAVVIAVAVAVAGAVAFDWLGRKTGRPVIFLTSWMVALWIILLVACRELPDMAEEPRALLLFLGFLPLLNATADFASVGLTRWLLRRGVRGNMVVHGLIDLATAAAILIALGVALIATVHIARPVGGTPLIDLAALFADLRDPVAVHDYYWLYFCFFSTLLPTVLHLMVACFGTFTLVSKRLGQNIAAGLASPVEATQRAASLAFTACAALAVWVPVMLLWLAAAQLGRPALDGLLWIFEGFARGIGAL